MEETSINELAHDLGKALMLADVDPAKNTISDAVRKFHDNGLRHLLVTTPHGGLLCLCSDPEMSRRIVEAVHRIDAELEMPFVKITRGGE